MAKPSQQSAPSASSGIEFSVLTYTAADKGKKGAINWKKAESFTEMTAAMNKAEELHDSKKYLGVDVRQKFFDTKANRNVDMSLKLYERKDRSMLIMIGLVLLALLGGAGAFALTYFLTKET
jgi:hypothetical protein